MSIANWCVFTGLFLMSIAMHFLLVWAHKEDGPLMENALFLYSESCVFVIFVLATIGVLDGVFNFIPEFPK